MATLLIIIIYTAFIGLGLPDSIFGTAWPAIYTDFSLPISYGSFVTVIISCGTVLSSAMSAKAINRFGTSKVSLVSTLLTAIALAGFSVSPSIWTMCLFAIPLGIGAGAIDVAMNDYVSRHYSATQMSFLHCFYGIGVMISPYILSLVINGDGGWRSGYGITAILQFTITLLLLLTLPVWKKVHNESDKTSSNEIKTLSFLQTLKVPGVKLVCLMFMASCGIEVIINAWGSTFLVEYKHLTTDSAARIIMIYFFGLALGRFLSGVVAKWLHSNQIIKIGIAIMAFSVIILLLPLGKITATVGLFLIALGNAPLFPNFTFLTPENFGRDISQSVMSVQMSFAYLAIMAIPPIFGVIGQTFGMFLFPICLMIIYAILIISTVAFKIVMNKNAR